MHAVAFLAAALASVATTVSADRIAVQVGANTTANASQIFQPQEIRAKIGDVVVFNFTNGTYDVIQSEFAAPCIPAHDFDSTLNGFNSGPRPTVNGTAVTTLEVPINDNSTIWFFENSTCAFGGVGVINANDSSTETLAGFTRNAERLNGTATLSSSLPSNTGPSQTGSGGSTTPSGGSNSTDDSGAAATRNIKLGAVVALPLAMMAFML